MSHRMSFNHEQQHSQLIIRLTYPRDGKKVMGKVEKYCASGRFKIKYIRYSVFDIYNNSIYCHSLFRVNSK